MKEALNEEQLLQLFLFPHLLLWLLLVIVLGFFIAFLLFLKFIVLILNPSLLIIFKLFFTPIKFEFFLVLLWVYFLILLLPFFPLLLLFSFPIIPFFSFLPIISFVFIIIPFFSFTLTPFWSVLLIIFVFVTILLFSFFILPLSFAFLALLLPFSYLLASLLPSLLFGRLVYLQGRYPWMFLWKSTIYRLILRQLLLRGEGKCTRRPLLAVKDRYKANDHRLLFLMWDYYRYIVLLSLDLD